MIFRVGEIIFFLSGSSPFHGVGSTRRASFVFSRFTACGRGRCERSYPIEGDNFGIFF